MAETSPQGERHDQEHDVAEEPTHEDLEALLGRRLPRRSRLLRAGTLLALVALVAAGLFWQVGRDSQRTSTLLPPATATVADTSPLLITSNVTSGQLLFNGQHVEGLPAVVSPHAGENTLTLTAAPFTPTRCTFTWPGFTPYSGNCSFESGSLTPVTIGTHQYLVGRTLSIAVRGEQLPADTCLQIGKTLADKLATIRPTTAVPSGQYFATEAYRNGIAVAQRAKQWLVARLVATFTPATADTPSCAQFGDNSIGWNPTMVPNLPVTGQHWLVYLTLGLHTEFTTSSGQLIGRTHDYQTGLTLDLVATANGQWSIMDFPEHAAGNIGDPEPLAEQMAQTVCDAGGQDLTNAVQYKQPGVELGWSATQPAGMYALQGCLLRVETVGGGINPPAAVLWRFGVLLAADATAHKLLPQIPMAPKDELAVVA